MNAVCPTFRFSGGALPYVPWHFVHRRPLQPVVMRLLAQPMTVDVHRESILHTTRSLKLIIRDKAHT